MVQLLLAVIYLAFVSLGLPDALLGAAWPTMYPQMSVPVSYAGFVSMTISAGTIISALLSDRLTLRFGAGRVTATSVAMTAFALFGFSFSSQYWMLILFAIPYGLGAGGVDAALNNYVAVHYESRHMSWLHAMWGLGAALGPTVMGFALSHNQGWNWGYRYIAIVQVVLTAILIFSLPLWKTRTPELHEVTTESENQQESGAPRKPLSLAQVLAIPGAKQIMIMFFCYCAIESTAMLWASSYMVLNHGIDTVTASTFASLFVAGITIGRFASGFMTMRFDDPTMIRIGQATVAAGVLVMFIPLPAHIGVFAGLIILGLGCAPIYPCVIHSTPTYFGADKSQAIVGVQMASAYVGSMLMPPVFGVIANTISIALFPLYIAVLLVLMVIMHEWLRRVRA